LWVMPHAPGALTFLAQMSPILDYLSKIPVNHCVRIHLKFKKESPPESIIERLRLQEYLFLRASQDDAAFSFYFGKYNENSDINRETFIRLVPLPVIRGFSKRVDDCSKGHFCASNINTLRFMAAIWCTETETLFSGHDENTELKTVQATASFKASFDAFIAKQTVTSFLQEMLEQCVDTANSVREKDGFKKWHIDSKYVVTQADSPSSPPATDKENKYLYEECVKILIEKRARDVANGRAKKFLTVQKIVSILKKTDMFEDDVIPTDSVIAENITQTQAWKDRKHYFAFLLKSAEDPIGPNQQQAATDQDVPETAEMLLASFLKEFREKDAATQEKLREIEVAVKKNTAAREEDTTDTKSANNAKATKKPATAKKPKKGTPPIKNRGKEYEGRKTAAVKYAIDNPGINKNIIEQKYDLSPRTLSRKSVKTMIENGRELAINAKKVLSKKEEIEFRVNNKTDDEYTKRKRKPAKPLTKEEFESKKLEKLATEFLKQVEKR